MAALFRDAHGADVFIAAEAEDDDENGFQQDQAGGEGLALSEGPGQMIIGEDHGDEVGQTQEITQEYVDRIVKVVTTEMGE